MSDEESRVSGFTSWWIGYLEIEYRTGTVLYLVGVDGRWHCICAILYYGAGYRRYAAFASHIHSPTDDLPTEGEQERTLPLPRVS